MTKRILAILLVTAVTIGILAGAASGLGGNYVPELEPWTGFTDEIDPAGAVTGGSTAVVDDAELMGEGTAEPAEDILSGGWETGGYLNDGGRQSIRAMVSFMDDDCREQVYDELFQEVIVPLEVPYTLALPIDKLDTDRYITTWQLQEMVDAGVTVSCHTFNETSMAAYTPEGLNELLVQWHETAEALGCGEVLSYAYCNGIWDDDVMTAVKANFRMGFTVERGINQLPYESFYMKRVGLFSDNARAVEFTIRDGTYLNARGTLILAMPGERMTTEPIPVKEGEEYLVTCSAVWSGACYAIYNEAGGVLEMYNVADTVKGEQLRDHKVRIPKDAAYMVVSHNAATHSSITLDVKKLPDESTLYTAKQWVDQVARDGGWLVFMTHAWYNWFDAEDLAELVTYIRDSGIPIADVNEAIRLTGNVIEVGTFRKPLEYAAEPYFVVSSEGRVYTNSLELPNVPEHYENVKLELNYGRVIYNDQVLRTADNDYLVSDYVDVSDCEAVLVSGWAYNGSDREDGGYQIYLIRDANGKVLDSYRAVTAYRDGGDTLDHHYIELPKGADKIVVAGYMYQTRPALTKIYADD